MWTTHSSSAVYEPAGALAAKLTLAAYDPSAVWPISTGLAGPRKTRPPLGLRMVSCTLVVVPATLRRLDDGTGAHEVECTDARYSGRPPRRLDEPAAGGDAEVSRMVVRNKAAAPGWPIVLHVVQEPHGRAMQVIWELLGGLKSSIRPLWCWRASVLC